MRKEAIVLPVANMKCPHCREETRFRIVSIKQTDPIILAEDDVADLVQLLIRSGFVMLCEKCDTILKIQLEI